MSTYVNIFSKYNKDIYGKINYYYLKESKIYDIMNAEAFIINYLKALADTQICDLLPAYRAIIS